MLIRYHNELFVIGQELPERYDIGNQSKQLLTVYSTRGQFNGTIEMRGLIGAYTIMDHVQVSFDLNLTYNQSDQHSEPRVGLVVLQGQKDGVDRLSLHRNLSVFTTEEVDTQIIYIDLINDFSLEKIRILMNGRSPFPEWKIIVIVLFSFIGLLLLVAGLVVGGKKIKEYREATRESLMTEESVPY